MERKGGRKGMEGGEGEGEREGGEGSYNVQVSKK